MNTPASSSTTSCGFDWNFLFVSLALFAGFTLSLISWQEVCTESCSATKDYLLFGIPFAPMGVVFFALLLLLHALSPLYLPAAEFSQWMIAGALGAEIRFIFIQKYEIGHWCPVCLSIAASLGFACLILTRQYLAAVRALLKHRKFGEIMKKIGKGFTSLSFVLLGFLLALLGVTKTNEAEAASSTLQNQLAFGNRNSPVVLYFVSDWFCPSCNKIEPSIEKIYAAVKSQATFYFIDYAIHQKSLNYTPYNLAFMVHDQAHYLQARRVLHELAKKNDSPTDEEVMEAARKKGLSLNELSFLQVKAGISFFDDVARTYGIRATPALIVANKDNRLNYVTLEGRNEITESRVIQAIEKVRAGSHS